MQISPEDFLPILMWMPIISLIMNFILVTFVIIIVQKGKLKPKEQQDIEAQMMNIVKQAELESTKIIEDATHKARQVVSDADATKKIIEQKLDKLVQETADIAQNQLDEQKGTILEKFRESYNHLVDQVGGETQLMLANLQHEAREIRKDFREALQTESVNILNTLKDEAGEQVVNVETEIDEYRKKSFQKIDEQAHDLIKQYINDYFSTELKKEDHESILFKALNKFKGTTPVPEKKEIEHETT